MNKMTDTRILFFRILFLFNVSYLRYSISSFFRSSSSESVDADRINLFRVDRPTDLVLFN